MSNTIESSPRNYSLPEDGAMMSVAPDETMCADSSDVHEQNVCDQPMSYATAPQQQNNASAATSSSRNYSLPEDGAIMSRAPQQQNNASAATSSSRNYSLPEDGATMSRAPQENMSRPRTTSSTTEVVQTAREQARVERRESDAARTAQLTDVIDGLGDESLIDAVQQELGNTQRRIGESSANARLGQARNEQATRTDQRRQAAEAQQRKGAFDVLGTVMKIVGAVVAVAAIASSVFTGPLGIVAAIGIGLACFGPMATSAMADAKILPRDVALGIGIGAAVIGTAMSLGAGAVNTATAVGQTAIDIASASVTAADAVAQGGGVLEGARAADRTVDADAAQARNVVEQQGAQAEAQGIAQLMQIMRRMAETLREAQGEHGRGATAATQTLRA